jgi:hypothetical protein
MPEKWYPRREVDRIEAEFAERVEARVKAELVPLLVSLLRHSDLSESQVDAVWADAVNRLFDEETKRAQAALAEVVVEGSA